MFWRIIIGLFALNYLKNRENKNGKLEEPVIKKDKTDPVTGGSLPGIEVFAKQVKKAKQALKNKPTSQDDVVPNFRPEVLQVAQNEINNNLVQ